jgi:very-short-patch-repair endonuclease
MYHPGIFVRIRMISGLVVEVDGDIPDLQQEEDARRDKALRPTPPSAFSPKQMRRVRA